MVLTLADSIHNVNPNFPGEALLQCAVTGGGLLPTEDCILPISVNPSKYPASKHPALLPVRSQDYES